MNFNHTVLMSWRDHGAAQASYEAIREGASIASVHVHLLKNLRETIEQQLGCFEAPIRESSFRIKDDLARRTKW